MTVADCLGTWAGAGLMTGASAKYGTALLGLALIIYSVIGLTNVRFSISKEARARAWAAIRRNNGANHCGHWCFRHPKERAWIAELDGRIVGSVFLVKKTDEFAKLRLLYVEPDARGRGIGRRSVKECIAHARAVGYGRMELWADDVLTRARKINQSVGFKLVRAESHRSFGKDLVGETWELGL